MYFHFVMNLNEGVGPGAVAKAAWLESRRASVTET